MATKGETWNNIFPNEIIQLPWWAIIFSLFGGMLQKTSFGGPPSGYGGVGNFTICGFNFRILRNQIIIEILIVQIIFKSIWYPQLKTIVLAFSMSIVEILELVAKFWNL